jgi:hypothetical protein
MPLKPRGTAPDIPIDKRADGVAILNTIDAMFETATVSIVLTKYYAIGDKDVQLAVLFAAMAACKGVAANAQAVFNKMKDCPDTWKIGPAINMTWLALLGHVIYAIPIKFRVTENVKTWGIYTSQTGLNGGLWDAGATPQVAGKDEKNQVLQKYKSKTPPSEAEIQKLLNHLVAIDKFQSLFKKA